MLKRIKIAWKLSAVFTVVILLALVASGHVNNLIEEHYAVATAREVSRLYFDTLRGGMQKMMASGDIGGLCQLMGTLVENNPVCRNIRLVSHEEGKVLAPRDDGRGSALNPDHPSCRICHDLDEPGLRLAVRSHDEILELPNGERIVAVTVPIFNEKSCGQPDCHALPEAEPVLGLLEADFSLEPVDTMIARRNLWTTIGIVFAAMLICGATWFVVNRFIKGPMHSLIFGMNRLAERKFDFRLNEDGKDEFSSLAASFNDMASMLSSSLRELQKTRDYIQGILESSADIIITVNATGKMQTFNMGAEKALGYARREVIGQSIEMLFADPEERNVVAEKLRHSDNVVNYETRFLAKGGAVRDVLLTLSRLKNPSGAIVGTIGIGKDITEEKRLQHQLIQSQRFAAIGEVFTGIQHSMKNLLNACKGGAFMVRTGLAKDDRKMLEEGWAMVQEGIARMTDMSMDMLKYVKEWKPRLEQVDLAPTLSEIHRVVKQTASDRGVEFRLDLALDLPSVLCDARMIHTAVMDIVSNALDACFWKDYGEGESPEVVLSAYPAPDGRAAVVEVRDNGCGMTEEVKSNIFTPFFSTKSRAGTGLGLSITTRIIGVHGGRIEVESEPERGAIFRIVLPLDGIGIDKENVDGEKSAGS